MKKVLCAFCFFAALGAAYAADNNAVPVGNPAAQGEVSKDSQPVMNPDGTMQKDGAAKDDAAKNAPKGM